MIKQKEEDKRDTVGTIGPGLGNSVAKAVHVAQQKKKEKGNGSGNDGALPDLGSFNVTLLSDEEVAERTKKARERADWALGAATKLASLKGEIVKLEDIIKAGGALTTEDAKRLDWLRKKADELSHAGDAGVQGHVAFATFLEEMRNASRTVLVCKKYAEILVQRGHYRVAGKAEHADFRQRMKFGEKDILPQGAAVVDYTLYLPAFKPEDKSAGQRAIEAEFTRLKRETYKDLSKAAKAHETEVENAGGKTELKLLNLGNPGVYLFTTKNHPDKRKRGTIRVEVYEQEKEGHQPEKFLRIIGAGGQRFQNLADVVNTTFVRFSVFKIGQPLPFSFLNGGDAPDGHLEDKADLFSTIIHKLPRDKQEPVVRVIKIVKEILKEFFANSARSETVEDSPTDLLEE